MDCLFCKIASKQVPAQILYEDEQVVVFEDIAPKAPVHLLIVPKRHIRTTLDLTTADNALIGHIFQVAGKMAARMQVAETGFRLVNNCNADAGQAVWHLHFHLLGGEVLSEI